MTAARKCLALGSVALLFVGCLPDPKPADGGAGGGGSTGGGGGSGAGGGSGGGGGGGGSGGTGGGSGGGSDAGADGGPVDGGASACPQTTSPDAGGMWPPAGLTVHRAHTADLDLDGFDDVLVVATAPALGIYILRGGPAGFGQRWAGFLPTGPYLGGQVEVADFTGDGCPDVVTAGLGDGGADKLHEAFDGFPGNGDLSFPLPRKRHEREDLGGGSLGAENALASGFLNSDAKRDLVRGRSYEVTWYTLDWTGATLGVSNDVTVPGPGGAGMWGQNDAWEAVVALKVLPASDGGPDRLFAGARNGSILYNASPTGTYLRTAAQLSPETTNLVVFPPVPPVIDLDGDVIPELIDTLNDLQVLKVSPAPAIYRYPYVAPTDHVAVAAGEFDGVDAGPEVVVLLHNAAPPNANLHAFRNVQLLPDGGVTATAFPQTVLVTATTRFVEIVGGRFTGDRRFVLFDPTGAMRCYRFNAGSLQQITCS